ncbi:hypothetical protein EJ04DRAFT_196508 [Polyplosphaeria fusca]|uniref:Uncharacterized protein n=1 Tax=Polyplosphaeria fusca TaxID=682080 RepID=A0A9P4RBH3_9PLEO|nr:hypothetical protein EJ04DRAFT_196508 [Polyplosphaeria fusca]
MFMFAADCGHVNDDVAIQVCTWDIPSQLNHLGRVLSHRSRVHRRLCLLGETILMTVGGSRYQKSFTQNLLVEALLFGTLGESSSSPMDLVDDIAIQACVLRAGCCHGGWRLELLTLGRRTRWTRSFVEALLLGMLAEPSCSTMDLALLILRSSRSAPCVITARVRGNEGTRCWIQCSQRQ